MTKLSNKHWEGHHYGRQTSNMCKEIWSRKTSWKQVSTTAGDTDKW